jgi:adenylate cyclase
MEFSRPNGGAASGGDSTSSTDSVAPSRPDIEAALERVLTSRAFATAPRQQALLKHIVVETLDGRGDVLKEFSIALDVFGRPSTFDPRVDSIVRVQASRLRNQLADYYAKDGSNETVRIEVPAGAYVAMFSRADPSRNIMQLPTPGAVLSSVDEIAPVEEPPEPAMGPVGGVRGFFRKHSWMLPAMGGAGGFALVAMIASYFGGPGNDPAVTLPSGPTIFVAQYQLIQGPEFAETLRDGLQFELIDSLSRFPELSVLGIDTVYGSTTEAAKRNSFGADFILTGSIQASDAEIKVTSQLMRMSDNRFVWSEIETANVGDASGMLEVQSRIAGDVATQLGQPYGVIQERLKEDLSETRAVSLEDYLCVMEAYDYSRQKSEPKHAEVRACLEETVKHSPLYSPAWAKLSWMYGDEARYAFNRRTDAPDPFIRAREAAEKAVAANPSSAMAHQYLAIAKFALDDDAGTRSSIETALRLNPNNSEILADAGLMLITMDASERGREMAEKAIAINPGHPAWYYGALAIYHVLKGNKAEALAAAEKGAPDGSPMGGYMLAAALRLNGNDQLADQALASLYATHPEIVGKDQEILKRMRIPERVVSVIFGR